MDVIEELRILLNMGQNKEVEHKNRVTALCEFEKKYRLLSNTLKKQYEGWLYLSYRELGALYYTTNRNLDDCLKYFEKSFEIACNGDYDSEINICISKKMYCKELILKGLENDDETIVNKAKEIYENIRTALYTNGRQDLKESVEELDKILEAIKTNNIWTKVSFEIPYYIILENGREYEFVYNNLKCKVIAYVKQSAKSSFVKVENGVVFNEKDKYGIINYSQVVVYYNDYTEPEDQVYVNRELGKVWKSVAKGIEIWNYFVKCYKVETKRYWIDNINEFMILNYSTKIYAGEIELANVPLSFSLGLSISNELPKLSNSENEFLIKRLNENGENVWENAYLDSLNQFQVRNYKEAIIQLNIALENYMFLYAEKLLTKEIGDKKTKLFLQGHQEYTDFYLKDYISQDVFEHLYCKGTIKDNPPTLYKIIRKCANYWPEDISARRISSNVNTVKKYRNEIIHGGNIEKNIEKETEKAIEAFEKIIQILNSDACQ